VASVAPGSAQQLAAPATQTPSARTGPADRAAALTDSLDWNPIVKVVLSAILLTLSAEIAKRSTWAGALILSLPLTSVLAMIWVYADTRDAAKIAAFSTATLWMVLPSLVLFIVLPILLRNGVAFAPALGWSCAATGLAYALTTAALRGFGIQV
jgi:F0F1-type ATP synthase assembly protein I